MWVWTHKKGRILAEFEVEPVAYRYRTGMQKKRAEILRTDPALDLQDARHTSTSAGAPPHGYTPI